MDFFFTFAEIIGTVAFAIGFVIMMVLDINFS